MVVDDDRAFRALLRATLEMVDIDVDEAEDAPMARRAVDALRPDVIVLDIAMPMVDGWTVLRKLRTNPSTTDIPVLIFTALDLEAVSQEAKALNVEAVIRKPASTRELEAAIRRALAA